MSDTTKIEIPTWKSMEKTYSKVWFKDIQAYFAAIGEHRVLDKNLAPEPPGPDLPYIPRACFC